MTGASRLIRSAVAVLLLQAGVAGAQDSLAAARQLYASASYDEALGMLDRLKSSGVRDLASANLIEQYRAFCLLAVGHQPDAERAMETIVAADPTFRPDDAVSPRLQAVFRDVRTRMLPVVVRQQYLGAKASFDEKAYQAAVDQFDAIVRLLDAPDVVAADPVLADLRTVASGFRDLAKVAAAPSPSPSVPASPATSGLRPPPAFYTADDSGVTAPVVIRQSLPSWPQGIPKPAQGGQRAVLDIVIDDSGAVESVVVRQSIAPWYDEMLIKEAKRWSYRPATRGGTPVRYRKLIQVVVGS
jgi:TonB family protein